MSDSIRRQLQQRVDSMRMAGVEFLPRCEGLALDVSTAAPAPTVLSGAPTHAAPKPIAEPTVHRGVEPRLVELKLLAQQVAQCVRCPELASTRTQTVFGVGPLDPELCFIGEAPGADEDRKGEPFVGAAGQLLDRIIAGALGMKREEVYICNILRCRPPGNRTPRADEAHNCREWLEQTLDLIRPRHICCLGATAAKFLLNVDSTIGRMRKKFHDYKGIPVLCTYHPSYLLRLEGPAKDNGKREVWADMKMLLARMGREDPSAKKS